MQVCFIDQSQDGRKSWNMRVNNAAGRGEETEICRSGEVNQRKGGKNSGMRRVCCDARGHSQLLLTMRHFLPVQKLARRFLRGCQQFAGR